MKIMIIGGSGRFGRVLTGVLRKDNYSTIPLGSKELDLRGEGVKDKIIGYSPDYIVHTAALSNVDECEKDPKLTYSINAYGTEEVTKAANRLNVPLLYISTDYVFDGGNPPYSEYDEPNPVNVYGESKLMGENFVKRLSSSIIVRVSWLFGPEKSDFIDFVLEGEEPIPIVRRQISKPTCTVDLSYAVKKLIERGVSGIYHFANTPAVSRLEWAETILQIYKREKVIREISWDSLYIPAKRPLNSTLSTIKYEEEFGKIRSWKLALKESING